MSQGESFTTSDQHIAHIVPTLGRGALSGDRKLSVESSHFLSEELDAGNQPPHKKVGLSTGFAGGVKRILNDKCIDLGQLSILNIANSVPTFKILWAPIVDSIFFKKFGRRKTWVVSFQCLTGIIYFVLAYYVAELPGIENHNKKGLPVLLIMSIFLVIKFFTYTQDIAVDGWALTMLSRKNIVYSSTCNLVGLLVGNIIGNDLFIVLQEHKQWILSIPIGHKNSVKLDGFVFFWAWVFIVSTMLIAIFKREIGHSATDSSTNEKLDENDDREQQKEEQTPGILEAYLTLYRLVRLKQILIMGALLLTARIAFATADDITDNRLSAAGIKPKIFAYRSLIWYPFEFILMWLLVKYTSGPNPLNVIYWAYPCKIFMNIVLAVIVYYTRSFQEPNGEHTWSYYVLLNGANFLKEIPSTSMWAALAAFFVKVSDPIIGGTYVTLLYTLNTAGFVWVNIVFPYVTELITIKEDNLVATNATKSCKKHVEAYNYIVDGYYVMAVFCTIFGLIWYCVFYKQIRKLQKIPLSEWRLVKPSPANN